MSAPESYRKENFMRFADKDDARDVHLVTPVNTTIRLTGRIQAKHLAELQRQTSEGR